MSNLFNDCISLAIIPDISKWNLSNVKNIDEVLPSLSDPISQISSNNIKSINLSYSSNKNADKNKSDFNENHNNIYNIMNNDFVNNDKNEEIDGYYENFYN